MLKVELFDDKSILTASRRPPIGLFERITSPLRKTPSVFIIGAQKAGTTTLFFHLVQHPQITRPKRKETFFFGNALHYNPGLKTYKANFAISIPGINSGKITLDATTTYLESPEAAKQIHHHFPNARIIVVLRNPVERAFSQYKMSVRLGFEKGTFEEAIEQEQERIEYGKTKGVHNYHFQRLAYVSKGRYAEQIEKWFSEFDRSRFLFVELNQWAINPQEQYNRLTDFLGINRHTLRNFSVLNKDGSGQKLNNATRMQLQQYYKPYNEELFHLLGVKYEW